MDSVLSVLLRGMYFQENGWREGSYVMEESWNTRSMVNSRLFVMDYFALTEFGILYHPFESWNCLWNNPQLQSFVIYLYLWPLGRPPYCLIDHNFHSNRVCLRRVFPWGEIPCAWRKYRQHYYDMSSEQPYTLPCLILFRSGPSAVSSILQLDHSRSKCFNEIHPCPILWCLVDISMALEQATRRGGTLTASMWLVLLFHLWYFGACLYNEVHFPLNLPV